MTPQDKVVSVIKNLKKLLRKDDLDTSNSLKDIASTIADNITELENIDRD